MRSSKENRLRGFNIIEVMTAMVILSFSIAAVAGLLSAASQGLERRTKTEAAMLLAERLINEVKVEGVDSYETREGAAEGFDYEVIIGRSGLENLAKVEVEVTWRQRARRQVVSLKTMVFAENRFGG